MKILAQNTRYIRTKIDIGTKILIERWDGNGIPEEVKVIGLKTSISRVFVRCNKGYFIFSEWNKSTDNIDFTWTASDKDWCKEYMKWVDGRKYYFNDEESNS